MTQVPSGGWRKRGGSLPCTQCGMPTHICPQVGIGENKKICTMYKVGEALLCPCSTKGLSPNPVGDP